MPPDLPIQGSMLGATLTVAGLLISWIIWRRKGAAAGLRGVAWSLLPLAAGLMGLMTILWRLISDMVGFFAGLVFNPIVWAGVAIAGLAVVLWVASGVMKTRGIGVSRGRKAAAADTGPGAAAGAPAAPQLGAPEPAKQRKAQQPAAADDDFGDIEELLRKRGIG
ncbi:cellulose synthase [Murinocardiopsis flavida]|nr:cellulose synthase [Murinocardiopsis flavida]